MKAQRVLSTERWVFCMGDLAGSVWTVTVKQAQTDNPNVKKTVNIELYLVSADPN